MHSCKNLRVLGYSSKKESYTQLQAQCLKTHFEGRKILLQCVRLVKDHKFLFHHVQVEEDRKLLLLGQDSY